jgi:hypothetical protein
MVSVYIVALHVAVNNIKIYVASSNKTYLDLHVNCPKHLSDFNRIWCFSKDFHTNVDCQF